MNFLVLTAEEESEALRDIMHCPGLIEGRNPELIQIDLEVAIA